MWHEGQLSAAATLKAGSVVHQSSTGWGQHACTRGLVPRVYEANNTLPSSWVVSIAFITSLMSHTPPPLAHAADDDVQLYWQELQRARVKNDFLVLDSGARFGGRRRWGSCIYLRRSYFTLWARIKELVARGCGKMLVTGDWDDWEDR